MSKKARLHLLEKFVQLSPYIEQLPTLSLRKQRDTHPLNAVSEVVIAQMLSSSAASSIKNRAHALTESNGHEYIAELTFDDLRSVGMSRGKAKTIKLVFDVFNKDPNRIYRWSGLVYEDLCRDVSSFWGISDWTASVLAISYFGNKDVFPYKDGSIIRVTKKLEALRVSFDAKDASPYQSYLALYLWAILDHKLLE